MFRRSKLKVLADDKCLDWSKLKALANDKLNLAEKLKIVFGRVENIVGKVENADYQDFLFLPQCFQKAPILWLFEVRIWRKIENCFRKGRKHCGQKRKCWLPAFSLFTTSFSKGSHIRVVISRDCVVKS